MSSIKLKHSGGNAVSLNPPTSAPTSTEVAFKLPNEDGSANQLLKTDASGNLGWATGGKILQVKSTPKTDTFLTNSSSFVDVTGLSVDIDPTAASSKILVLVETNSSTTGGNNAVFRLMRDSTAIALGTANSNRPAATFQQRINDTNSSLNGSITFLDAPTYNVGDTLTYKVQVFSQTDYVVINRTHSDTNTSVIARTFSSITVMEVGA